MVGGSDCCTHCIAVTIVMIRSQSMKILTVNILIPGSIARCLCLGHSARNGWGLSVGATAKILTTKSKNGQSAKILNRENNQLYIYYLVL